ncbi:acetyl-CoA carboxylase biotin carboxyl carrier protein [Vallitalea guaymasensis]|uniref:acetyl-CoA carboxylase biotin carboxyl carrier protein n=1 Tax=Vallitalea guaymasensis TaxID=1185412 RepID=UPI002354F841|nr:acetyl-CoA carboxylase biotin carboxyl carrier protein subunit [Vallitalea guaymasensis]
MDYSILSNLLKVIQESNLPYVEIKTDELYLKVKNNQDSNKENKAYLTECKKENSSKYDISRYQDECVTTEIPQNVEIIKSPLVGKISLTNQNNKQYISIGNKVNKGDIVCTIEAMKMVNEIVSKYSGTVVDILVKPDELVEYGRELFVIQVD